MTSTPQTSVPDPARPSVVSKGLKVGALGLAASIVIGVASTAPAYSLASALGWVVESSGIHAPGIMLIAFVPILLTAIGYQELNRAEPDCGTTFTWAARTFGSRTGWMGGWGIIAADVIVMANLAQIAGGYFFELFGWHGLAASTFWVTLCGVIWIVLMTALCYAGIELSARIQQALLAIEVVMLLVFAVTALVKVYGGSAPAGFLHPSLGWLNPFGSGVGGYSGFTGGVLVAIFIYWGWDSAVSVNEETADASRTPGRAAIWSTVLLLVTYVAVTYAAQAFAGTGSKGIGLGNEDNSGDVLSVLGGSVFGTHGAGWVFAKLLVLMVLTSAAASTQTTILPTARTVLSMSSFRALPKSFSRIHPRFRTPSFATIAMGIASIGFYVVLTMISANVLSDSIDALGVMIAFYYAMTGYTCTWFYRATLTSSFRNLMMRGVLPTLGALMLTYVLVQSLYYMWAPDYGGTSWTVPGLGWDVGGEFIISVVTMAIGAVLMFVYNIKSPDYFRHPLADSRVDTSAGAAESGWQSTTAAAE
ncbi:APC family permease [Streptomyces sp. TS71-3]|uniref:APC family permease n=1 Tax=Streptomyces sp. TS71-3 TaxID=2733862 RepID=UPI001B011500|nr:APC family permease [Streptomyces sp. TS71-3]GHJ37229.1 putative amino acid permease [Streptomyces sp. TS71-3]